MGYLTKKYQFITFIFMYELCLSSKDRKAVFKLSLVLPYMWKMTPRSHNEENSLII